MSTEASRLKRLWFVAILLGVGLFGWLFDARVLPTQTLLRSLVSLELTSYDVRLGLLPERTLDDRIVLVAVDDASIQALGRWPWDRDVHAQLLRRLTEAGARVIGFDISFDGRAEGDKEFGEAVGDAGGRVVLVRYYNKDSAGRNVPHTLPEAILGMLGGTRNLGSPGLYLGANDPDNVARRLPLVNVDPDWDDPYLERLKAFSVVMLERFLEAEYHARIAGQEEATLGSIEVPVWGIPQNGQPANWLLINYPKAINTPISYVDVLTGEQPESVFHDKLVLIGNSADFSDTRKIPPDARPVPGFLVHAAVMDTLLGQHFITYWRGATWGAGMVLTVLFLCLAWRFSLKPAIAAGMGLGVVYMVLCTVLFVRGHVYLEIILPMMMLLAAMAGTIVHDIGRVRQVLGLFAPSTDVEGLVHAPERMRKRTRVASVLFVDIRDYTVLSERFPASKVRALVSRFHQEAGAVFQDNGGYVCDFQGDAQMVAFGVAGRGKDHALQSISAALALPQCVQRLNRELAREYPDLESEELFRYGVGICTGEVSIGYLKGGGKLQYSVIGDTTNTAARLQGTARDFGVTVVVSHTTVEAAGKRAEAFPLVPLPPVTLKGKAQPHAIFELECDE